MSDQSELLYRILKRFEEEQILGNVMIVGSWCMFFYKHHYEKGEILPPLRTRDVEFDVNLLRRARGGVSVVKLLQELGFISDMKGSGFTTLSSPELIVEFLVPEKGKGSADPLIIKAFELNAQPIRYLNLLEEQVITISYRDLEVLVPHPAWFAIHKLIISQRRPEKQKNKSDNDIIQALSVWDMLDEMGESSTVKGVIEKLPKGWLSLLKQALEKAYSQDKNEKRLAKLTICNAFFKGGRAKGLL
jgi:hypothetical protein